MAHHPMFESDPENPVSPTAEIRAQGDGVSSATRRMAESDLSDVAAKFAAHSGGLLSAELSAELALEIVLNEIVQQACLATGANGAAILLRRDGEWVCRASAGKNAPHLGSKLDAETGLSGACVKTREVQRCDDTQDDPRVDADACRELGVRSLIILPIILRDVLAGIFEVFSSRPSAFAERDERTLEALSQRVLKNLGQPSAPPTAAVAEPSPVEYTTMADLIVSDLRANPIPEGSVAEILAWEKPAEERPGALNFTAEEAVSDVPQIDTAWSDIKQNHLIPNHVTPNHVTPNLVTENSTAQSNNVVELVRVSSPSDFGSSDGAEQATASVEKSSRGIHLVTWVLGVTVVSVAVLLATLAGQRLSGRTLGRRAHPRLATATRSAGVGNQSTTAHDATFSPGGKRSEIASSTGAPTTANLSPVGPSRSISSSPPVGSLLIYEKGKEIFRLPPEVEPPVQMAAGIERESAPDKSLRAADGVVRRVEPEYPEEARQNGIEGPVVVDVDIDREGKVLEVKTVSGSPVLAAAVIDAVKQWVFKPHSVAGQLVPMQTRITLNFRLPH